MSDEQKVPALPPDPNDPAWQRWCHELGVAFADHDAVLKDQLRKKRKRDLGIREAKRLADDSRAKVGRLLALLSGGGDGKGGDESGGSPGH